MGMLNLCVCVTVLIGNCLEIILERINKDTDEAVFLMCPTFEATVYISSQGVFIMSNLML